MNRNLLAVPSLAALLLLGCGGQNRHNNAANTGAESGAMPADSGAMTSGTGMSSGSMSDTGAMRSDTGMSSGSMSDTGSMRSGAGMSASDTSGTSSRGSMSDSAKGNQTKSGVTNTKTGKSTLGKGVTKTRPDQGEPVTSKGDTVSPSGQPNPTSDTSSSR